MFDFSNLKPVLRVKPETPEVANGPDSTSNQEENSDEKNSTDSGVHTPKATSTDVCSFIYLKVLSFIPNLIL